ncbi:MAG: thiamine-monophosphate kinase [Planctomycetes bacterium]|nr:thiamine-monophosphate kinase [Planctomycetota bacterium]
MAEPLDPDAMPSWLATVLPTRATATGLLAGVNDDDCAVMQWDSGLLVATTDYVNSSPIAVELDIGDHATIGRLAVAASLADLLGSGAAPRALLLAVTMPRDSTAVDFQRLIVGANDEAQRWNIPIVGGDTKLGRATAVCSTALGYAPSERNLFLKFRAREGDILWTSGELGGCSAAVLALSGLAVDDDSRQWAVRTLTTPALPFTQSRGLSELALSVGGTDVSDGLGADLCQLCSASRVGAIVEATSIPLSRQSSSVAEKLNVPAWSLAFGSGGDFQFLATTPPEVHDRLVHLGFSPIGRITRETSVRLRLPDGRLIPLPELGHRDGRRTTFSAEIQQLVRDAANAAQ